MMTLTSAPSGVFTGRNFMTPDVIAYYRITIRGRTAYVELSSGEGMSREVIYGVTVRATGGDRLTPDPSTLCHSRGEATTFIRNLPHWRYAK